MPEPKIIYDFGSNNGDDIPYYLEKADKVVAVEANPGLVAQIVSRFSKDIAAQKLIVEHWSSPPMTAAGRFRSTFIKASMSSASSRAPTGPFSTNLKK